MRRSWFRSGLAGAIALAIGIGALWGGRAAGEESAAKKHGPIAWIESLPKAQKAAQKQKKVILVDFYAEWCGPCKEMLATTYKHKEVVARSKKFVPVLIDVDKQQGLAAKYEVEGVPTILFLDAKGKVLLRSVGYLDADSFLKLMDEAAKKAKS